MKTQFLLTDIPVVLRDALEVRGRTLGTSAASLVGAALAKHYGLEATNSLPMHPGFQGANGKRGITMNLRLPSAVVAELREDARASGRTQREIVLTVVARSLKVKLPKPHNRGHGRPRGRKVKA